MNGRRESDLYLPVKGFLEAQGFRVRGEVGRCDLLAVREDQVIAVELKLAFSLPLIYQALDRQAVADLVYVAVAEPGTAAARNAWRRQRPQMVRLCRRLGLGLLSVSAGGIAVHAEPGPYRPRRRPAERTRLLREFERRSGDHNAGGVSRVPIVTAYREEALRCGAVLASEGALPVAEIRRRTGVERAGAILLRNVYGWFARTQRGVYALTPSGRDALRRFAPVLASHRQQE